VLQVDISIFLFLPDLCCCFLVMNFHMTFKFIITKALKRSLFIHSLVHILQIICARLTHMYEVAFICASARRHGLLLMAKCSFFSANYESFFLSFTHSLWFYTETHFMKIPTNKFPSSGWENLHLDRFLWLPRRFFLLRPLSTCETPVKKNAREKRARFNAGEKFALEKSPLKAARAHMWVFAKRRVGSSLRNGY